MCTGVGVMLALDGGLFFRSLVGIGPIEFFAILIVLMFVYLLGLRISDYLQGDTEK